MKITYKPLRSLLAIEKIKVSSLPLNSKTIAKINKDEEVSMQSLLKICEYLNIIDLNKIIKIEEE